MNSIVKYVKILILVVFFVSNNNVSGQEEKETLSQRLDRLEKQNEEFRKLLEQKKVSSPVSSETDLTKPTSLNNTLADILALPTLGVEAAAGVDGKIDNAKTSNPFKWTWKDGLKAESENKDFSFHLMTSVQFDNGWYSVGDNIQTTMDTRLNDGSDLRRARVRAEGTIYKQFEYQFDFDVSGGSDFRTIQADPQAPLFITEAWMAMNEIPIIGQIRVGHQKEFMTFSNATSHRFQAFMERPLVFDAFEDGFQFSNGISIWDFLGLAQEPGLLVLVMVAMPSTSVCVISQFLTKKINDGLWLVLQVPLEHCPIQLKFCRVVQPL